MGAEHPIVLEPQCPSEGDTGIVEFLHLARALTQSTWVELELRPVGTAPVSRYLLGETKKKACTLELQTGVDYEASLRLGVATKPEPEIIDLLSSTLERSLEFHGLLIRTSLLGRVLEEVSHSVIIFDDECRVLYANPPADATPHWRGVIDLADGRMMGCEVTRVAVANDDAFNAVLVTLQTPASVSKVRIQDFASSHRLSRRELEVLHLLGQGLTTAAMAEKLGISPHTVRDHLKHLYRKTGTKGRSELLGLISRATALTAQA
ncbi:MAG: helix-turn-helix transcriptional regulator [Acidobacteriota bacterium]